MENEVYFCKECNLIYPSCWEINNEFICSTCFSDIKIIKLKDLRKYKIKLKLNDKNLKDFLTKIDSYYLSSKEKKEIVDALNNELRKQKLMKIFDNE